MLGTSLYNCTISESSEFTQPSQTSWAARLFCNHRGKRTLWQGAKLKEIPSRLVTIKEKMVAKCKKWSRQIVQDQKLRLQPHLIDIVVRLLELNTLQKTSSSSCCMRFTLRANVSERLWSASCLHTNNNLASWLFLDCSKLRKSLSVSFSCDKQFMFFGVDSSHLIEHTVKESSCFESQLLATESTTERF